MPNQNNNSIDFSKYVAIGDSVTAGYADGALFYEGQESCYPNLIAAQINLIQKIEFKQALTPKDSVGIGFFGNSRFIRKEKTNNLGLTSHYLDYLAPQGDLSIFAKNDYKEQGPFNNMAVPGIKATTVLAPGYGNPQYGEGNYNPFFTRMTSNPLTSSVLSDTMTIDPTFFSVFVGNNDVLAYALSGGIGYEITPIEGEPGIGFKSSIHAIINALMANGTKGVIANIPDITCIPYFTTIPYNGLIVNDSDAHDLSEIYKEEKIEFHKGHNAFVIEDSSSPNGVRQLKEGELILQDIQLDPFKIEYLIALKPIPKKYVLLTSEVELIQRTIDAYNNIIQSLAHSKGLAFVDLNCLLKAIKTDRVYDAKTCSIHYKEEGVFSLDGIHINTLGQVLLANEFIKEINQTYGVDIPKINLMKYKSKLKD